MPPSSIKDKVGLWYDEPPTAREIVLRDGIGDYLLLPLADGDQIKSSPKSTDHLPVVPWVRLEPKNCLAAIKRVMMEKRSYVDDMVLDLTSDWEYHGSASVAYRMMEALLVENCQTNYWVTCPFPFGDHQKFPYAELMQHAVGIMPKAHLAGTTIGSNVLGKLQSLFKSTGVHSRGELFVPSYNDPMLLSMAPKYSGAVIQGWADAGQGRNVKDHAEMWKGAIEQRGTKKC